MRLVWIICVSGKHIHCSGWEVEGLFLCISVFSCRSTLLAHGEKPLCMKHPLLHQSLGHSTPKPSNLVGWRIICGGNILIPPWDVLCQRKCVTDARKGCNARGQALRLTCPGTVSYHLSLTNCVHLAAIFSKTLTQWYFVTTPIFSCLT